jgi:hypothetical protein
VYSSGNVYTAPYAVARSLLRSIPGLSLSLGAAS